LADAYREAVGNDPNLPPEDAWLRESYRWQDQDHARVAALSHLVKHFRRGAMSRSGDDKPAAAPTHFVERGRK
jgi:hypothetical protein